MRKGKVNSSVKSPTIELMSIVFKGEFDIEAVLNISMSLKECKEFMVMFYGYFTVNYLFMVNYFVCQKWHQNGLNVTMSLNDSIAIGSFFVTRSVFALFCRYVRTKNEKKLIMIEKIFRKKVTSYK